MNPKRVDEVSSGVFLLGLGFCFVFGFWPGIMFVIGATSIVRGLAEGQGWYAFQGAVWTIGFGVWALYGFSVGALFVMIGLSTVLAALARPPFLAGKPKPFVDNSLE